MYLFIEVMRQQFNFIIKNMIKQLEIQEALKSTFPEFYNKSQLINYYVSFQYPEKQMKMISWWQKVIQFIIQHEHKVYITFQQLASYLSIYNLKPTPLPAILNHLANKQQFGPENQYEIRATLREEATKEKSFFGSMMSYFSKPESKEVTFFQCQGNERIFSRKIKEYKKQQIKKELNNIFSEHCRSKNQFKLTQELQQRIQLDHDSIMELLRELNHEEVIKLMQNTLKPFVLYSHNSGNFQNQEWCQIQKMKYCLRDEIDKFEYMIGNEEQKMKKMKERAKEHMENGNKKSAHTLCREVIEKEKKLHNIITRKNLLQNQISQLEYNQMNKNTITLIEEAQNIYDQTAIDPSKLDEIVEKNLEIENNNKQINEKLEDFANRQEEEDGVDELMKELENEVQPRPARIGVHVQNKMEFESMGSQRMNAPKKMDVEYNEGQKMEEQYY